MRILCAILLVCLIVIGSVSALTVGPATAPALKTIAATPQPTVIGVLAKPVTAVAVVDVWVTLEINSIPSGATVIVDGQSTMPGTTPYKIALHPGSHTVLLTLDGYKDYSTTVNLQAGNPVAFDAQLQRVITAAVGRENMAAVNTIVVQPVTLRTIAAAASSTQDNTIACLSGQECLTLAEAGERFMPGWYYTEGSVCGYNGSVQKYCISGSPKMTVQQEAVQAAIQSENKMAAGNATPVFTGTPVLVPSGTPRIMGAQRQVGVVESILGFFSGLFAKPIACPDGKVNCGGGCVDSNSDSQNCGGCGYTCFEPAYCCFGSCEDSCDYCTYSMQWGTEGTASGQFKRPQGIAVDSAGNVYVADTNNNRIQKFNSAGGIIATWGNSGSGSGQFSIPAALALDTEGNVYVAESGNNRVQKFNSMGGYISQWGTKGSGNGQFLTPSGIAVDSSGNVYVAESGNDRVQKFNSMGGYISQWGYQGSGIGHFMHPHGIAIDSSGNVYVTDYGNDRVQKFTPSGGFISLLGTGTGGSGNGQFLMPFGVAIDPSGNIYTIEIGNQRVQRFDSGGTSVDQWGTRGFGSDQFEDPMGIATDSFGNVYVTDSGNDRVQKFSCL